ncbi:MAG: DUF4347 domain-containing protein [Methylococcaceae bacterium]
MMQSTIARQLIVIDSQVTDWQSLVAKIPTDAALLVLDPSQDGINQIAEAAASYSELASIHVVSHGRSGCLLLGSSSLTNANINYYSKQLSIIGNSLSDNSDILLYGCEVAAGVTGFQFIEQLGAVTGANIAASAKLTGAAALGGDWLLEAQTGVIETKIFLDNATQANYSATLAFTLKGIGNGITSSISDVTFAEYYEELGADLSISSLLGGSQWGSSYGATINTTYLTASFSTANSVYSYDDGSSSAVQAFAAAQITAARSAMAGWAAVANIVFTETTDSATNAGDIRWGQTSSTSNATAYAYYPDNAATGGDIWIDPNYPQYYQNPVVGSYGYHTYIHELGHALGLGHPHQGYTTPEPGEDQLKYSIMSYRSYAGAPLTGYNTSYYPTTPMLNDILAIQFLYGENTGYHSGNNTYQWTSTQRIYETIWDAGGIDTINASNQAQGVVLNLNAGQWCQIGVAFSNGQATVRDCLTIAYGTIIENAIGSAFNDTLTGNDVANSLEGGNGDDALNGGKGNDLLDGGAGIDILNGGVGDDTFVTDNIGDNTVENVNAGIDSVQSSVNYTLTSNVENLTLTGNVALNGTGNELANTLTGNANNNLLNGATGNDTLKGGMGNDFLTGGNGADTYLFAMGDGQDGINNFDIDGSLDQVLFTNVAASDVTAILRTIDGFDNLIFKYGDSNQLTVEGFFSDLNYQIDQFLLTDVTWSYSDISARATTVNVSPTADNQTIATNEDTTYIFAAGNFGFSDVNAGDNLQAIQITSLAGAGALLLNNVAVILNQTIAITDINSGLLAFTPAGNANGSNYASFDFKVSDGTVFSTAAYTLTVNVLAVRDDLTLTGTAGNDTLQGDLIDAGSYDTLSGLAGADILQGYAGNDSLFGGDGNDLLEAGNDDDQLDGGKNNDSMIGGSGNDIYFVDSTGDTITETSILATEIDTVNSAISYTLGINLENLTLTGTLALKGTGNSLNNVLTGNIAANTLDGDLGADTLIGGLGNDTYIIDNAGDTIIETSTITTEIDRVNSTISYLLGDNVEYLTLTGTAEIDGTGNTLNNTLTGNSGANTLNGGNGADRMIGGLGNDTYIVDNTSDSVNETSTLTTEIDLVNSEVSHTLRINVENLNLTGTAAINGTGNTLDNVLTGNTAANILNGSAGNDILNGLEGADILIGGLGKDSYTLTESASSTDTVKINAGDSLTTGFDVANSFVPGTGSGSTNGVDKLDLAKTLIAANATVDGIDSGIILSHSIANGLINFDDADSYSAPLAITASNLTDVFNYLTNNIINLGNTVAFNTEGNTFVFQDGGISDTLIELTGVTAAGITTTGLTADMVWIA